MAPEAMISEQNKQINLMPESDIYSMGKLLIAIFFGEESINDVKKFQESKKKYLEESKNQKEILKLIDVID